MTLSSKKILEHISYSKNYNMPQNSAHDKTDSVFWNVLLREIYKVNNRCLWVGTSAILENKQDEESGNPTAGSHFRRDS